MFKGVCSCREGSLLKKNFISVPSTNASVLIEAVECQQEVIFPLGTGVNGVVRSVRKVGWGVRHETAALELHFDQAVPPSGPPVAISADVSVNDCFRPVSRFFDRITRPEQLLTALPEAMRWLSGDQAMAGTVCLRWP